MTRYQLTVLLGETIGADFIYRSQINSTTRLAGYIHRNKQYIPNKLIAGSLTESMLPLLQNRFFERETKIFICVDGACQMPTSDPMEAIKMMKVRY